MYTLSILVGTYEGVGDEWVGLPSSGSYGDGVRADLGFGFFLPGGGD